MRHSSSLRTPGYLSVLLQLAEIAAAANLPAHEGRPPLLATVAASHLKIVRTRLAHGSRATFDIYGGAPRAPSQSRQETSR